MIIGINRYEHTNNLNYASNDAQGIYTILKDVYQFQEENITLLLDEEATRDNIMKSFLRLTQNHIQVDDRIIIFYAGHGYTLQGRRGDIGYLIPHNGNANDLSTLIRWDELTRNAELIRAKHMLYIMDACYSGLAIKRSLSPGSNRFLKDMLKRNARQVITSGKANEQVDDSNGPLPNHSIFTGHLIEGLNGNAALENGIITANGLMSYVYQKVSQDNYSDQTPHFGFIEGDGDFIFNFSTLSGSDVEEEKNLDYLIEIPSAIPGISTVSIEEVVEETKEFLTDIRYKIKLDDLVNHELRKTLAALSEANFPNYSYMNTPEDLVQKLNDYENTILNLRFIGSCISYWGQKEHYNSINKIIMRLIENVSPENGNTMTLSLRYYPIMIVIYSCGISAIANENYEYLAKMLTVSVEDDYNPSTQLVLKLNREFNHTTKEKFKLIPEHGRYHVAFNEYMYKFLQPSLDDLLFLGKSYEKYFDFFEIMFCLLHADLYGEDEFWGPMGRFAWKIRSGRNNPFKELLTEANSLKDEWPPIKAGLFRGSYERFTLVSQGVLKRIADLHWY
ncbi:caspase family protein [Paenibacillus kandeliae]|uniref:caspase family protein n=1 Tax=Paenibacillus kandeliae TaxID=3231269 RepID=UPI00345781B9